MTVFGDYLEETYVCVYTIKQNSCTFYTWNFSLSPLITGNVT